MTDKELPDRQALAGSLGLDAAGEEPLLAQLVRMHLKGGGAQQPAAVAAASASSPANASSPSGKSPARERVGAHSTLRDLPSLSKPGHGGGLLGDLPSLGGRGAPAGGGGSPGGEQQDEEERRLDAIESKLAGYRHALVMLAPRRRRAQPTGERAEAVARAGEHRLRRGGRPGGGDRGDRGDRGRLRGRRRLQLGGGALLRLGQPARAADGGRRGLAQLVARARHRPLDGRVDVAHPPAARVAGTPAAAPSPSHARPILLPCPAALRPSCPAARASAATRVQTRQGFDHTESVEPPRAAAPGAARGAAWQPGM